MKVFNFRKLLLFKSNFYFSILCLLALNACSDNNKEEVNPDEVTSTVDITSVSTTSVSPKGNVETGYDEDDLLEKSVFSTLVKINFGQTITIENPLAGSGVEIDQESGDVTIQATASEIEYELSGSTDDGSVKIYSDKKFKLTLNGVAITNPNGPAINIQSKKRAFVVSNENTTNNLIDGSSYTVNTDEDQKGTFFSEGQLIFEGNGTLNLTGNTKHALVSDDYIRVVSGTINIAKAASDGIHSNEAFIADGGTVSIANSGDGIQVEEGSIIINDGDFDISVSDKGISANWDTDTSIDPFVNINGGRIKVNSSGGEGIESKSILTINGGEINISTKDDGLNASAFIYINGGSLYVNSSSNDAIDSNGEITVTGGTTVALGAASPEESFDCDKNTFTITGGILVGIAGATSSPTASVSTQPSVILGKGTANELIHIETDGNIEALTFKIPRSYTTMLFSSPKLKLNTAYKVYTGGSVSESIEENGIYLSGKYSKGTEASSFTISSMVTTSGGSTGPGGGQRF